MKASRWSAGDLIAHAVLSVGALSWGLLGFIPIDLTYQPFGSIMVYSRTMCLLTALAVLFVLTLQVAPRSVPVRIRRRRGYT